MWTSKGKKQQRHGKQTHSSVLSHWVSIESVVARMSMHSTSVIKGRKGKHEVHGKLRWFLNIDTNSVLMVLRGKPITQAEKTILSCISFRDIVPFENPFPFDIMYSQWYDNVTVCFPLSGTQRLTYQGACVFPQLGSAYRLNPRGKVEHQNKLVPVLKQPLFFIQKRLSKYGRIFLGTCNV